MKKSFWAAVLAGCALAPGLFGAEIIVSHLELASRGAMEDGDFGIRTSAEADISLQGGYKYGIILGLGAEIPNLQKALSYGRLELPYASTGSTNPTTAEYDGLVDEVNERFNNQATLSIRSVAATVRELFGGPLEASFFIGHYDKLGSGEDFQELFGSLPVTTDLRGFLYYPEGLGGDLSLRFNGAFHSILGTGAALKAIFLEKVIPSLYIYHDLSFRNETTGAYLPGHYSADFRLLVNSAAAKFEIFTGTTYVTGDDPVVRGGILAFFDAGSLALLMQAGVPYWEVGDDFDIDNWYFLLEPRFQLWRIGSALTFFYHPVYYMNRLILDKDGDVERGKADVNFKIFYGDINRSSFEGGVEATLGLTLHNGEDISLWLSPFVQVAGAGLLWNFKLRFNALYFKEGGDFAEGFIGIRTAY
ncbi:MAG: hypothetical protein LBE02_00440 [Spirochaetaceae bacterium]|jgi:hypothetical protein|nr:hypothetical protein [Spirochaetaceae bacterium]